MTVRTFHLGAILTVTTGRFLSPGGVADVGDLLGHMTGESLMTHQIPRAVRECGPALLVQHPQLAVEVPDEFDTPEAAQSWLDKQVALFGSELPVAPLDPADHTRIDPITELKMIRPDMPVIGLSPDGTVNVF